MIQVAVCGEDRLCGRLVEIAAGESALRAQELAFSPFPSAAAFAGSLEAGSYYQLVFAQLDGAGGLETGRLLRRRFTFYETLLVYWTAGPYSRLPAQELFETAPFQLLVEPISDEDLRETLLAAADSLHHSPGLYVYRRNRASFQVRKSEIVCLESKGRNLELTLAGGRCATFIGTMKQELEKFTEVNFAHPHLSYLVNFHYVEEYHPRHLVMQGGKQVPISEKRAEAVRTAAMRYWKLHNL